MSNQVKKNKFRMIFGPGLLFAASSVGVSHIVQSTRAGAEFGLGILITVLLVNFIKYPAFQFGTQYSLATGTTLLQGYRNMGKWAVVSYGLLNLIIMPIVFAALSLATSGVMVVVTGTSLPISLVSLFLMLGCVVLLKVGGYSILEKIVKILVIIFTVLTFIATVNAIMNYEILSSFTLYPMGGSIGSIFFIVPLIGLCTFAVLFSTVITVIDGFPRALMISVERLGTDEVPWQEKHLQKGRLYFLFMVAGCLGHISSFCFGRRPSRCLLILPPQFHLFTVQ